VELGSVYRIRKLVSKKNTKIPCLGDLQQKSQQPKHSRAGGRLQSTREIHGRLMAFAFREGEGTPLLHPHFTGIEPVATNRFVRCGGTPIIQQATHREAFFNVSPLNRLIPVQFALPLSQVDKGHPTAL
jgi:hypothetical protein